MMKKKVAELVDAARWSVKMPLVAHDKRSNELDNTADEETDEEPPEASNRLDES